MIRWLGDTLMQLGSWLRGKSIPPSLTGGQWSGTGFADAYRRRRSPTPNELMEELKGVAWACASMNASVCADFAPRLYVRTSRSHPEPKCLTRPITRKNWERFQKKSAERIEEVLEHPLLTLLAMPTPPWISLNAYDHWELTTLYLEVHGRAFWYLERDGLGTPRWAWILPAQNMTAKREPDSPRPIDYWEYRTGTKSQYFDPQDVLFFRYPDPKDPYTGGLSPLRACFEQVSLSSHYAARKQAIYENDAIPAALISPEEVIGEEERDRLEVQWNQRLRRGGAGKVIVAESKMNVGILQHSLGDLALLAEQGATKEMIANAFHVPISYLTAETNMANLQAADHQHMAKAISPRLHRRDEKLNESLVPLFDDSGRLFLASEDPVPVNSENDRSRTELYLRFGLTTINELRGEQGLPPVPWGDLPWLPLQWAQTDFEGRAGQESPAIGRNKPEKSDE